MIRYRKDLLKKRVWHKFVITGDNQLAKAFCHNTFSEDGWTMWQSNVGNRGYAVFLIGDENDANLFAIAHSQNGAKKIRFVWDNSLRYWRTIRVKC